MQARELLSAIVELQFRVLVHEKGYSHGSVSYVNGIAENLQDLVPKNNIFFCGSVESRHNADCVQ